MSQVRQGQNPWAEEQGIRVVAYPLEHNIRSAWSGAGSEAGSKSQAARTSSSSS